MGMSVDEILTTLPHITPSQAHSALAYYFDHQGDVDKDLAESSDVELWKSRHAIDPQPLRSMNIRLFVDEDVHASLAHA